MHLRTIEFQGVEPGHCCEICNPMHLADYETRCVPIRAPDGSRAYFCRSCVRALARAAEGKPGTNQGDLERWRDLETRARPQVEARPQVKAQVGILELLDDLCDVCLETPYPARTPKHWTDALAPGWHTVIHPLRTMALHDEEPYAISLCCPACSRDVHDALRVPTRTRGPDWPRF
jgi:hypothetical protein